MLIFFSHPPQVSNAGVVQVKAAVDFDAGTRQYDVTVQVSDGANLVNIAGSVVIGAVNEAAPVLASPGRGLVIYCKKYLRIQWIRKKYTYSVLKRLYQNVVYFPLWNFPGDDCI